MIVGTDVSFWQDDNSTLRKIDFARMKANGAEFVIIRVGQATWVDKDFLDYWHNSKGVLPRGTYWYYDNKVNPVFQAELYIDQLSDDYGELPMWADFEDSTDGAFGTYKHWHTFIERLKVLTPNKEIGIYTRAEYFNSRVPKTYSYFTKFPLWIAHYGADKPDIPRGWADWTLWQHTENGDGLAYGVESKGIDLNYFNGDLQAFQNRFNLSPNSTKPIVTWNVTKASGRQVRLESVERS